MAVHKVKRGDKVYLSEYKSVREGKKVKSIFVRYLGPEDQIKGGKKPKRRVLDRIQMSRSNRAGDVRLLWQIAEDLDFIHIIDRICCQESYIEGASPGKFLTIWAINRALDPESCTQLERWVKTTDLPLLAGIEPELFNKDAFLSSLDFVVRHDRSSNRLVDYTTTIDDSLYQHHRHNHPLPPGEKETVAYDITSVLFFGVTCPLAELGYNSKKVKRQQVNLALLVSRYDKHPIAHFVYNGSRHSSSTVKNLVARLKDTSIGPGTIIWDRGNVSKEHVKMVEDAGWNLICGIPKTSKDALNILRDTEVSPSPLSFIRESKSGSIYARKVKDKLFDQDRDVVVYMNQKGKVSDADTRNKALFDVGGELEILNEKGSNWSEKKLHEAINSIKGDYKKYIWTRVSRKKDGPRVTWGYKKRELEKADSMDGKYLLYSTDESRDAGDVVNTYLEKDFIEKVFRMLKTDEEMEPVRHRLEHRVRAYMFICVLAYRLLSALQFKFREVNRKESTWEQAFDLLRKLGRVERTEVVFGKEVKTLYLNVTKSINDKLKKIGMKDLLNEEIRPNM